MAQQCPTCKQWVSCWRPPIITEHTPAAAVRTRPRITELPDWDDCAAAVKAGDANALQKFIYNNEPDGKWNTEIFREQLQALLDELAP